MKMTTKEALQKIKELKEFLENQKATTLEERLCDGMSRFVSCNRQIEFIDGKIKIPLPGANREWTLEAYQWVIDFIKKNPKAYPTHNNGDDADYITINISNYR